jgi:SpoVK/Ycf46/Vps4 family AAA+-type ATPase
MATNMRSNIDESFIRRFNSMLRFPFPDEDNRAKIWERALPKDISWKDQPPLPPYNAKLGKEVNIPEEVKKYELSGGNIVNVIHYAALKAAEAYNQQKLYARSKAPVPEAVTAETEDCEEAVEHAGEEPELTIYLSDVLDGIRRELIKEGKPFAL